MTEIDITEPTRAEEFSGFPPADQLHYGVPVGYIGDDGDVIAAGHGRRSHAAINATLRSDLGIDWTYNTDKRGAVITPRWAVFSEECGCGKAEHGAHEIADKCPNWKCHYLPPCSPNGEANWTWEPVNKSAPGAVPVLCFEW